MIEFSEVAFVGGLAYLLRSTIDQDGVCRLEASRGAGRAWPETLPRVLYAGKARSERAWDTRVAQMVTAVFADAGTHGLRSIVDMGSQ